MDTIAKPERAHGQQRVKNMFRMKLRVLGWTASLFLAVVPAHGMEVVKVTAGASSQPGIYTMEARILLDTRPVALRYVVSRLCEYQDQLENLSYCRVFKAQGTQSWSYVAVLLPVIAARDYVSHSEVTEDLNADGTGTYRSAWQVAPGMGPAPREGVVRLAVNSGSWRFSPSANGKGTVVDYSVTVAPGGSIPSWAARHAAVHTLPSYMRLLERLSQAAAARGIPAFDRNHPWEDALVAALDSPLPPTGSPLSFMPDPLAMLSFLK